MLELAGGRCNVYQGNVLDVLKGMPADWYHCIVTSPPYWGLRAYLKADDPLKSFELGSEATPAEYIENMVAVFRECRRVLHPTGVLWVNIGDTYSGTGGTNSPGSPGRTARVRNTIIGCQGRGRAVVGYKPNEPIGIPDMLKNALRADGWRHRDTIIWHKISPMPASLAGWRWERHQQRTWPDADIDTTTELRWDRQNGRDFGKPAIVYCPGCDKCRDNGGYVLRKGQWRTTPAHEYLFMFVKSDRYFCDAASVKEPASSATIARNQYTRITPTTDAEQYAIQHDHEFTGVTRNPHSVQTWSTEPCKFGHYATYPSALPRFCIKAATSPKGCCPHCGMPWSPVVDHVKATPRQNDDYIKGSGRCDFNGGGSWTDAKMDCEGYRQSCQCPFHEPIPCRILDPFAGTGTTLAVGVELGCEATGIELNPVYIPMIEERMAEVHKIIKRTPTPMDLDHPDKPIEGKVSFF